ncbi:MAG: hypothetical protein A2X94_10005 [Bdellovibrionales bacterium GWB1_55_8]|nr:MAG: hypothetical protein A2X94_10005 [Bdellovibrionales bacterium GWB1_55_8]
MRYRIKGLLSFFGGAALGAGALFVLDPVQGRRRRALLQDKWVHGMKQGRWYLKGTALDFQHRVRGAFAEARSLFKEEQVEDDILVARVRSKIGRVITHPHAIQVSADKGSVTLNGPIPESEADRLLSAASSVRGVKQVTDHLDLYHETKHVPSLQGEGRRRA